MLFKIFITLSLMLMTLSQTVLLEKTNVPEYLSITADSASNRKNIFEHINKSLSLIYSKYNYPEILQDLMDIHDKNKRIFKEPSDWHTTCLYIGNDLSKLNTPFYTNFEEGKKVDIKVSTLVYIPKKIIAAPVFPDYNLIENRFPHVTIMLGKYKAVDSNFVIEALYENYDTFKELYDSGSLKSDELEINLEVENITINTVKGKDDVERAFIIKFNEYIILPGVLKKNYRNSKLFK